MNHIVIIGFMGSGKTRVGKRIAKDLELDFVDLDKIVTAKMKMPVSEIFQRFGEPFYRAMETYSVKSLLQADKRMVISLGAAFPCQEQNEEYIRKLGTVVYLKGSANVILGRLREIPGSPLETTGEEKIIRMLNARDPVYRKFADITVETGVVSFDELVRKIETELKKTVEKKE